MGQAPRRLRAGRGFGAVVLERADHAIARGARIYARLAGAGITSDGFDIVQPDPECKGGIRAMSKAIKDAGLTGADRPRQRARHLHPGRRHRARSSAPRSAPTR